MDKEQRPIIQAMIRTSYREPIEKIINFYVDKAFYEIMATVTINGELASLETMSSIGSQMREKPFVKAELGAAIDAINETDVIAELMTQYGLDKDKDKTIMHDELVIFFRQVAWNTKQSILAK